mmetsp:Transcript_8191/g.37211  ORF Transcript_8191/g.37211 Transcript_8191/m.37211 type:complete len:315 (-) Transcript_8191:8225-9169(-)
MWSSSARIERMRSKPCLSQNVSAMASHSCPARMYWSRWNSVLPTAPSYSLKNLAWRSGRRLRRPKRWLRSTLLNTSWRSAMSWWPSAAHSAYKVPKSFSSHSAVCVTSRPMRVRCASLERKRTVSFAESEPGRLGSCAPGSKDGVDGGCLGVPSSAASSLPSSLPSSASSLTSTSSSVASLSFSSSASFLSPGLSLAPIGPVLPPLGVGVVFSSSSSSPFSLSSTWAAGSGLAGRPAGIAAAAPTAPGGAPATASSAQPFNASSVAIRTAPCVAWSLINCRSMRRKSCLCSPPAGMTRDAMSRTHAAMQCATEP